MIHFGNDGLDDNKLIKLIMIKDGKMYCLFDYVFSLDEKSSTRVYLEY